MKYFVCAQLENHVNVEVVLEVVEKFHDVFVIETFMDFDFAHELL